MRIPALDDRCFFMVVYCLTIIYHFVKLINGSMYQCYIYHIFTNVYIDTIYNIHYTICIIQCTIYNIHVLFINGSNRFFTINTLWSWPFLNCQGRPMMPHGWRWFSTYPTNSGTNHVVEMEAPCETV